MRYILIPIIWSLSILFAIGATWYFQITNSSIPLAISKLPDKPLEKYSFEKLDESVSSGKIFVKEELESEESFTSYLFTFEHYPDLSKKSMKSTGMINIPKEGGNLPVIILIRGYVDQSIYQTGVGTKNASYYFAEKGFVTISLDYLGYGGSDENSANIFESRFQTYTSTLALLKSLEESAVNPKIFVIEDEIQDNNLREKLKNFSRINIWGHSNGGQIALTVLAISGKDYPTVLWAPVSKSFPYSVLYYTDESADKGKFIRSELAKFEELYDVEKYSVDNYLNNIIAPLQIHQGTADDAIPLEWTNNLVENMEELNKDVEYFTYPGTDHNMRPSWDMAITRSLEFYTK